MFRGVHGGSICREQTACQVHEVINGRALTLPEEQCSGLVLAEMMEDLSW
jgi:hypothetical protein